MVTSAILSTVVHRITR